MAGNYTLTINATSGGTSPVSAVFSLTIVSSAPTGSTGPVQGDYNADGKTDFALFYRQPNHAGATWFVPNVTPASGVTFENSFSNTSPSSFSMLSDGFDIPAYRIAWINRMLLSC